jgi:hypothetical protein
MKKSFTNSDGAIPGNDRSAEIAGPRQGSFDFPATPVTAQRPAILGARLAAIPAVRCDQFDSSRRQRLAQRVTVVSTISNDTLGFCTWLVTGIRRAGPASEQRSAKSRECLRELALRSPLSARRAGMVVFSAASPGSSPIGRRSIRDRLAPSVLPWRCSFPFSGIFSKASITRFNGLYAVLK